MSVSVDIFYLPNSGYFDKTGVFQQPRLVTTTIGKTASDREGVLRLLQLRVLRLDFFQDGDVGVGVFPASNERQKENGEPAPLMHLVMIGR
jgi:hypothetical protein